jgi:predicted RNA-binding protein with PIN domain
MQPGYLVDGYNVIHREPALKALLESDGEAARERLISMLAGFRAGRRVRVTVVFDGRGGTGLDARTRAAGVQAVYAHYPETADARIVKLVRSSRHPRSLTVVSSDRGLVTQCRDSGAAAIGADEFLALVRAQPGRRGGPRRPDSEKPVMKPGDAAEWAEFFRRGGVDVDRREGRR